MNIKSLACLAVFLLAFSPLRSFLSNLARIPSVLAVLIISLLMTACGGGGGGTEVPTNQTITISGEAVKGIIVNGLVTAEELNPNGTVLAEVGTTHTNVIIT
jgi:hypothetical protein